MLEANLWGMASDPDQSRLAEAGNWLQTQVKSSLEDKKSGEWAYVCFVRVWLPASLPVQ